MPKFTTIHIQSIVVGAFVVSGAAAIVTAATASKRSDGSHSSRLPFASHRVLRSDDVGSSVGRASSSYNDDTMWANTTFDEMCVFLLNDMSSIYYGAYQCECPANTTSVTCSTPFPQAVEKSPNLEVSVQVTAQYADPTKTTNGTDTTHEGLAPMEALQICYNYSYLVPSDGALQPPPRGCLSLEATSDGKGLKSCTATLSGGRNPNNNNGTMEQQCTSRAPCPSHNSIDNGPLAIQVDCGNVDERAVTSSCFPLDGSDVIFPEFAKSFGQFSGASSPSPFAAAGGRIVLLLLLVSPAAAGRMFA